MSLLIVFLLSIYLNYTKKKKSGKRFLPLTPFSRIIPLCGRLILLLLGKAVLSYTAERTLEIIG